MKPHLKQTLLVWLGVMLIRAISVTLRTRMNDEADFLSGNHPDPYIFALWHNRLLASAVIFKRYFRNRKGVTALISRSRDGRLISNIILRLGMTVVSGSSSRGGAAAIMELASSIRNGMDVAITPDGPRGPRYKLGNGLIYLAQKTGAPVVPVHVEYSRCIRFRSWDGFMVPLPFSRVDIHFGKMHPVAGVLTEREFQTEKETIEKIMQPVTL